MKTLRFAVIGCGFWSHYQIPGWLELDGVELVALCDRTLSKANELAARFGVRNVYNDAAELLAEEELDFVDIVTGVDSHSTFAKMAADKGVAVVSQKPMAPDYPIARSMVENCRERGVPLFINENFRWQTPIRRVKAIMDSGTLGRIFKGRVTYCSHFPVFDNQPFLAELDHFILADVGSHILDVCRFLFGEAESLYCLTQRVNPKIQGEDVANVLLKMENSAHCYAEMSYASIYEREAFPQPLLLIEGEKGSIRLDHDYHIKVTTEEGTRTETAEPHHYQWADPAYALVHSSIVEAQRNIAEGLRGGPAETTGSDNLESVKLVWASYASAESGERVRLAEL